MASLQAPARYVGARRAQRQSAHGHHFLVRFATGQVDLLEPYAARIEQRFNLWIGRQIKAGRNFNEEQMNWLKAIRDYLAANGEIAPADLMRDQPFSGWGGVVAARKLFGAELNGMLDALSEALVA
ncbi:MAG: type I restriction-modification enzyme R subunit C-terminal domain-containing protein [Chromatiales bacterium]